MTESEYNHWYTPIDLSQDGAPAPWQSDSPARTLDALLTSYVHPPDGSEVKRDRQLLLQSEERFRILSEVMPQFVWVSDPEGKVEYVNRRWTEYTGQNVEQTGPHRDDIIHPEDAPIMWERWKAARGTGTDYEVEFRCRRRSDGAYRWFLARGVPLKSAGGQILRWIGTSTDIDAKKQAEAQVSLLNARLHRAIYESSHRIKNQLQVLAATVDMVLMSGEALIPADEFRRIGTQIRTLSVLQDILTLEWKNNPLAIPTTHETVSSRMLLERVIEVLQQTTHDNSVRFQIADIPLPLRTATTLALLCNELASNAIKHGKHHVQITFTTQTSTTETSTIETNEVATGTLEVCDDGPGFPRDFDPVKHANTGLELIGALTTYDLHGTVRYTNRPEGGAHVVISFPIPARTAE